MPESCAWLIDFGGFVDLTDRRVKEENRFVRLAGSATIPASMLFLRYYLWIAPNFFLGAVFWIFIRRDLHKQFPYFSAYVFFNLLYFLTSFVAAFLPASDPKHPLTVYRWIMVWGAGVVSLLGFCVIYELVNQLILPRSTLATALRPTMRWSAAVLLLLTAVASARLGVTVERVMNVFEVLDFSTAALQVGLVLVLLLVSRLLQLSWRSLPMGIAVGLGILGCVGLSTAPMFSVFGAHRYAAIDVVRMTGFHICVLVWLAYLIFPDRGPKFGGRAPQESDLESWDKELQRMVGR